jgi:Fe-S cluster biogenesis protein NfuA
MDEDKVKAALVEVAKQLAADGGGVELDSIDGNVVKVKLTGACGGCPMAQMTLQGVVEARLKEAVPEIEKVESV